MEHKKILFALTIGLTVLLSANVFVAAKPALHFLSDLGRQETPVDASLSLMAESVIVPFPFPKALVKKSRFSGGPLSMLANWRLRNVRKLRITTPRNKAMSIMYTMFTFFRSRNQEWFFRDVKALTVRLEGENGQDLGGVQRDFFEEVAKQAFASDHDNDNDEQPAFTDSKTEHLKIITPQNEAPWVESVAKDEDYYRGMFLATAFVQGLTINTFFKPSFYKLLLGKDLLFEDLREDDSVIFDSLKSIVDAENVDGCDLTFTVSFEDPVTNKLRDIELIRDGNNIEVTNDNKLDFVRRMASWHLYDYAKTFYTGIIPGFRSVLEGTDLIDYSPSMLKEKLGGVYDINVEELKQNGVIRMFDVPDTQKNDANRLVEEFWTIFANAETDMKQKILKFITASSTVPVTGLKRPIEIWINGESDTHSYPASATCFNTLKLPLYEAMDEFKAKLTLAVTHTSEIDGEVGQ